jgi:hypothetical protein
MTSFRRILTDADSLSTWTAEEPTSLLREVRRAIPGLVVEWDLGAGEGWARILLEDDLCAAIRAPTTVTSATRFAFLKRDCAAFGDLSRRLEEARVEHVAVDDLMRRDSP